LSSSSKKNFEIFLLGGEALLKIESPAPLEPAHAVRGKRRESERPAKETAGLGFDNFSIRGTIKN
jgi:hypothetical protein